MLVRIGSGSALSEGDWLIAGRQNAGRGRLGRQWQSKPGNFHGSTLVRLAADDPPAPTLALVAGVALHSALTHTCGGTVAPLIKWPNDIMLDGAKLAGILLERQGDWVVVWVGVNFAWAPDLADRATIALSAKGLTVDPAAVARTLAAWLAVELAAWRCDGVAALVRRWMVQAHPTGTPLSVDDGGATRLTGSFDGLEQDGGLRLRLAAGTVIVVRAGDIALADDALGDGALQQGAEGMRNAAGG